jgi:hypothetical protein
VSLLSEDEDATVYVPELVEPPSFVQPVVHFRAPERYFQELLAVAFGQKRVIFMPCGASAEPYVCHYRENPGAVPRGW